MRAQATDDVEIRMRRDRAGCFVSTDEIFVFHSAPFEIYCEKERWATGVLTRRAAEGATTSPKWTLELSPCVPVLTGDAPLATSPASASVERAFSVDSVCRLSLEVCLVGACDGDHVCMTRVAPLQAWKVKSARSFVHRQSLGAISEMCVEWSDSDDGARPEDDGCAAPPPSSSSADELELDDAVVDETSDGDGHGSGDEAVSARQWSLVPWKGELSVFDRAELLRNVRKRYEDLMHEYHSSGGGDKELASEDLFKGELTWFSAGIRIGVGVGLGVCLGVGLGVGVLINGVKVSRDRLNSVRQALRYK